MWPWGPWSWGRRGPALGWLYVTRPGWGLSGCWLGSCGFDGLPLRRASVGGADRGGGGRHTPCHLHRPGCESRRAVDSVLSHVGPRGLPFERCWLRLRQTLPPRPRPAPSPPPARGECLGGRAFAPCGSPAGGGSGVCLHHPNNCDR